VREASSAFARAVADRDVWFGAMHLTRLMRWILRLAAITHGSAVFVKADGFWRCWAVGSGMCSNVLFAAPAIPCRLHTRILYDHSCVFFPAKPFENF